MSDFIKKIENIANSSLSEVEKLKQFVNFMAILRPVDNSEALKLVCDYGISFANRLGRPEMEAQFYITRAKVLMMRPAFLIHEMKNITLAPNWFQFALESEKRRYIDLDTQVKRMWTGTRTDIEKYFEAINKHPVAEAVAFCLKTEGEIYGQHYLQLKLYYFKSKSSFRAKLANINIFRYLGIDNYFVLDSTSRSKLRMMKKDCLHKLRKAAPIFKKSKNYDYLADVLLATSTEHRSFSNPIRERLYLIRAERLIKKYNIKELKNNLVLMKSRKLNPFP